MTDEHHTPTPEDHDGTPPAAEGIEEVLVEHEERLVVLQGSVEAMGETVADFLASPPKKTKNHATKNVVESRALEQMEVRKAQSVKLSLVGADGPREDVDVVDEDYARMGDEPIPGSMAAKVKSFHAKIIDGDAL